MTDTENIALPALGGVSRENPIPRLIRSLVAQDQKELERSRVVYSLASPQMRVFGILVRNSQALEEFAGVFTQKHRTGVDPLLELDRHMLNYLASANAVLDHFDRAFKRRTRSVGKPDDGFTSFRKHLEDTDDVFQFFCEFRNYAIHSGLPIGHLSENGHIKTGRTVRITHKSKELLGDGRGDLKECRLLQSCEEIELMPLLRSFHETMMSTVFTFVVECLMHGLVPAQRFHAALAQEVKRVDPNLRPVIVIGHTRRGPEFQWSLQCIPDDIFSELGIQVTPKAPNNTLEGTRRPADGPPKSSV